MQKLLAINYSLGKTTRSSSDNLSPLAKRLMVWRETKRQPEREREREIKRIRYRCLVGKYLERRTRSTERLTGTKPLQSLLFIHFF